MVNLFTSLLSWIATNILKGVFNLYDSVTTLKLSYLDIVATLGQDTVDVLTEVCMTLAVLILVVGLYTQIFKSLLSSATGDRKVNPLQIAIRFIIIGMFIIGGSEIFKLVYNYGNDALNRITSLLPTGTYDTSGLDSMKIGDDFIVVIMSLIMAYQIFFATINQVQRYVTMYIYYFLMPVGLALGFTNEQESARNYFTSLLGQIMAILFNIVIFRIMRMQIANIHWDPASNTHFLQKFMITITLCSLARHSEQLLIALNIHAMPTPHTAMEFARSLMRVARTGKEAVTGLQKGGKAIYQRVAGEGNYNVGMRNSLSAFNVPNAKTVVDKAVESSDRMKPSFNKAKNQFEPQKPLSETELKDAATVLSGNTSIHARKETAQQLRQHESAINENVGKVNDFLSGQENGLTNAELNSVSNFEDKLKGFQYDPDALVKRSETGGFEITGTQTDKNGIVSDAAYDITSDKSVAGEIIGDRKYSNEATAISNNGDISAYRLKPAPEIKSLSEIAGDKDGAISVDALNRAFKPQETMNGYQITSGVYNKSDDTMTLSGYRKNPDGTQTEYQYGVVLSSNQDKEINGNMAYNITNGSTIRGTGSVASTRGYYNLGKNEDGIYRAYPITPKSNPSAIDQADYHANTTIIKGDNKADFTARNNAFDRQDNQVINVGSNTVINNTTINTSVKDEKKPHSNSNQNISVETDKSEAPKNEKRNSGSRKDRNDDFFRRSNRRSGRKSKSSDKYGE